MMSTSTVDMGVPALEEELSVQRQPERQNQAIHDGLTVSVTGIKISPSEQEDSQGAEIIGSELALPEDIQYHVHTLLPMRDAARAACLSRGFLSSWRCYPKLIFNTRTLGINKDRSKRDIATWDFISRVDNIMQTHSGIGVKIFKLRTIPCYNPPSSYVDRWLQIAISPGIEEVELELNQCSQTVYKFPCSLLFCEKGSSIRSLVLADCAFHYTVEVGPLSSLTSVDLSSVHISGEELCCFLSNCSALEQLSLSYCNDIVFLEIPCLLSQLNFLQVQSCEMLQTVESNAPNLFYFYYVGSPIHISLGVSSLVRVIKMICVYESDMLYYARTKLPSIAPNLQTLYLSCCYETVDTPIIPGKFIHLKYLEIVLGTPSHSLDFDFYSLVSFVDASPVLESFVLRVEAPTIRHDSIIEGSGGDSFHPRCLSEYRHESLRNVMITGFCSAKSMVDLTCHILEKTTSLECLTLDTTRGFYKRFANSDGCFRMKKEALVEADNACLAIRRHIEGRVPSTVNLKVIEPCSKCQGLGC